MSDHRPFNPGDEVFVVSRVHENDSCASKFSVVAHLKGDPDREIRGTNIDGVNFGVDSGWFKLISITK
jgi:hypothetical protein